MLTIQFEKQRTPPQIISFGLHLYFGFKLSSRDVRERLREELGFRRSHEAVRGWVQRTNRATRRYFAAPLRHVRRITVDESEIRVGGEWVWLWAALEPTRRVILEVHISALRNGLTARWRLVRGGTRSYVERLSRTIKDRLQVFNCAFPRSTHGLTPALIFIRFYAFYYNEVRQHRTLGGSTPIPTRGATRLQRLQQALEVTRKP